MRKYGHIQLSENGEMPVVTLLGHAGDALARELESVLHGYINRSRQHIIVMLDHVASMNSTVLGLLMLGQTILKENGGSLRVVCRSEKAKKFFGIAELEGILEIHDTVQEAVSIFRHA